MYVVVVIDGDVLWPVALSVVIFYSLKRKAEEKGEVMKCF